MRKHKNLANGIIYTPTMDRRSAISKSFDLSKFANDPESVYANLN